MELLTMFLSGTIIGKILTSTIWWWMVNVFKWRCIVVEMRCIVVNLTNSGWIDGSGTNPSGGFGKSRGGRETRGGGDGLKGPGGPIVHR
ncbi:hypothetical protein Tco_0120058 [Tanacetum coccineum]